MPTQWKSIAPLVGRTAQQCLEHYEKLLDEAQSREAMERGEALPSSLDEVRRLRPGEIDPTPETKAARPDPVDMDEDEKEMLSEARARLANTQGKKAKRKAREKQLEEARRLSSIAKRRELRAAGIAAPKKELKKGQIDYNMEIPFERRAPAGFFDVLEEKSKVYEKPKTLEPPKRRAQDESEQRQKDIQQAKKRKELGIPAFALQKELEDDENAPTGSKIILPTPLLGGKEIEQIVKASVMDGGQTPFKTPLMTPQVSHVDSESVKMSIFEGLKALPKPKNDYEIIIPEDPKEDEEELSQESVQYNHEVDMDLLVANNLVEKEMQSLRNVFTPDDIKTCHEKIWSEILFIAVDKSGKSHKIVDLDGSKKSLESYLRKLDADYRRLKEENDQREEEVSKSLEAFIEKNNESVEELQSSLLKLEEGKFLLREFKRMHANEQVAICTRLKQQQEFLAEIRSRELKLQQSYQDSIQNA